LLTDVRTEGVGSLLRDPALLAARRRHESGECSHAEFKRIEDRAVAAAISLQEEVGLGVVSDGELRRRGWMTHFFESVDGFRPAAGPSLPWRGVDGELPPELRGPMRPVVVEPMRWRHSACAEEWTFLRGHTDRAAKVTLISAEMAAAMYEPERSAAAYPTREAYFAAIVALLRQEVAEVVRLGCRYVQLDAPQYGALLDPSMRELFRQRGGDPDAMIDAGIEMDNAIIAGFPGVTFGLHICRGNNQSRFYAEGDYSPVGRLFERSAFDRFLLRAARPCARGPHRRARSGDDQAPGDGGRRGAQAAHRAGRGLRPARAAGAEPPVRVCFDDGGQRDQRGRPARQARVGRLGRPLGLGLSAVIDHSQRRGGIP
jgi:5-methyltetrahydropteroyltriglutamate--homocysteine methyltransferase